MNYWIRTGDSSFTTGVMLLPDAILLPAIIEVGVCVRDARCPPGQGGARSLSPLLKLDPDIPPTRPAV
jgi:hypothetical protein